MLEWGWGKVIRKGGGLFNLAKCINQKMISILHKELERQIGKVMQPNIEKKFDLPARK